MRIKANNAIFMDDAGGTIMTIYDDKVGIGCTDPDGTFEVRNGQSQFRANGASSNPVIIQNTATIILGKRLRAPRLNDIDVSLKVIYPAGAPASPANILL